jgi:hypothetical protein
MKKLFVWALMATMLVAGSAFGAGKVVANATFGTGSPATTNNDDSCDISTAPAATLLLPYFEVDLDAQGAGETTLFTITNTSSLPQVAHVTVWTDWSFPVLDFNVFLTGYDVQSLNLWDIIGRGRIAPEDGTSSDVDVGELSEDNDANPLLDISRCDELPKQIPAGLLADLQSALTTGTTDDCDDIGDVHDNAIGYITVDVASNCSTSLPIDAGYFDDEINFDNVLIGDYQQVNSTENFAQGNPMVHIRAIPEGGTSTDFDTNFVHTFYSRYQGGGTTDRRQPLPAVFAARWIQGGTGDFQTSFKIWREGVTGNESCDSGAYAANGFLGLTEFVRFDEAENPETFAPDIVISPAPETFVTLPETSLQSVASDNFPPNTTGDVGGWMYMNLNNDATNVFASQNWVVVSMRAEGRYSVDFDAAWLGNGCSDPVDSGAVIGPLDNTATFEDNF